MREIPVATGLLFAVIVSLGTPPALGADTSDRASIQISFANPQDFTDSGYRYRDPSPNNLLNELKRHLEDRSTAAIPAGSRLQMTITDVDMAGRLDTSRNSGTGLLRVYRDVDPPRIKFEFKLVAADGRTLAEGGRELTDLGYLGKPTVRQNDPLRYEKALLQDWLDRELSRAGS